MCSLLSDIRRPRSRLCIYPCLDAPFQCYNVRMNKPLKLIKIGNSTGVILPKEVLARLHVELGDEIYLSDAPDGYRMTPSDPDFEATMQIAEDIMKEDRDILRVQIGRAHV